MVNNEGKKESDEGKQVGRDPGGEGTVPTTEVYASSKSKRHPHGRRQRNEKVGKLVFHWKAPKKVAATEGCRYINRKQN